MTLVTTKMEECRAGVNNRVVLNVGGKRFEVSKEALLSVPDSYFTGLLGDAKWKPDKDGSYFIDRDPTGFKYVLKYLREKELYLDDVSKEVVNNVISHFDYFLIPFPTEIYSGWRADPLMTSPWVRVKGRFLEWQFPESWNDGLKGFPVLYCSLVTVHTVMIKVHALDLKHRTYLGLLPRSLCQPWRAGCSMELEDVMAVCLSNGSIRDRKTTAEFMSTNLVGRTITLTCARTPGISIKVGLKTFYFKGVQSERHVLWVASASALGRLELLGFDTA
jgi:hypothetical protein